jgi:hypothetical protein
VAANTCTAFARRPPPRSRRRERPLETLDDENAEIAPVGSIVIINRAFHERPQLSSSQSKPRGCDGAVAVGVELTLTQQITVVLMSVLAGIGTAGVPGGSLPLVAILLLRVGVPPEGLGIILGVDRLLDMCRTTLNVTGDIAVAACVDRTEK